MTLCLVKTSGRIAHASRSPSVARAGNRLAATRSQLRHVAVRGKVGPFSVHMRCELAFGLKVQDPRGPPLQEPDCWTPRSESPQPREFGRCVHARRELPLVGQCAVTSPSHVVLDPFPMQHGAVSEAADSGQNTFILACIYPRVLK